MIESWKSITSRAIGIVESGLKRSLRGQIAESGPSPAPTGSRSSEERPSHVHFGNRPFVAERP